MDEKNPTAKKSKLRDRIDGKKTLEEGIRKTNGADIKNAQEKPAEYFHQYFSDSRKREFPPSLVIADIDGEKNLILSEKTTNPRKGELKFLSADDPSLLDGGYKFKLFSNRNMLQQAIDNFKAGHQFSRQQMDKVFVAVDRGIERALKWADSKKEDVSKTQFKDADIPFSELQKIGIEKEDLSSEDIRILKKGGYTSLKAIELKHKRASIKNTPEFRINLERDGNGEVRARLTFRREYPDLEKDAIGSQLTREERQELAKNGKLAETKNFMDGRGVPTPNKITLDPDTNQVVKKPMRDYSLGTVREITETYELKLNAREEEKLREGKSIKVNNIHVPARKGVYKGELDLNPITGAAELKIEGPDRGRKRERELTKER